MDAILIERDYKGSYERLALTCEEFQKVFSAYPDMPSPNTTGNSFTLTPLVHIWYRTATVGDAAWTQFFTDMADGLPQSDIARGNLAYIREDLMQSLREYLPPHLDTPSLDDRIQTTCTKAVSPKYDQPDPPKNTPVHDR